MFRPAIAKSYYAPLKSRIHRLALKCGNITSKQRRFLLFVYELGLVYTIPYLFQDQPQCQQFPCWPYRATLLMKMPAECDQCFFFRRRLQGHPAVQINTHPRQKQDIVIAILMLLKRRPFSTNVASETPGS